MFISNGIVYGGEPEKLLKVTNFKILTDKMMLITFSTGKHVCLTLLFYRGKYLKN